MSEDPAKLHVQLIQPITLSAQELWFFEGGIWLMRWMSIKELRERYPETPET